MTTLPNWQEEWRLADHLVGRIADRCSGAADDECLRNYPRDVYFVGSLRPQPTQDASSTVNEEFSLKLAPVAFGLEVQLKLPDVPVISLPVHIEWSCYYRIFPTLDQQRKHQGTSQAEAPAADAEPSEQKAPAPETDDGDQDEGASGDARTKQRTPSVNEDSLSIRFRKLRCRADADLAIQTSPSGHSVDTASLKQALEQECQRAAAVAADDDLRLRASADAEETVSVPADALGSQEAYDHHLRMLTVEVIPEWHWNVLTDIRRPLETGDGKTACLSLTLVNTSPSDRVEYQPGRTRSRRNTEPFLFDTKAELGVGDCRPVPFRMRLAPESFRYDADLWARGFNCAAEVASTEGGAPRSYATVHVPKHEQYRHSTRDEPRVPFADLLDDPSAALETTLGSMIDYQSAWEASRAEWCASSEGWEAKYADEFDRASAQFDDEISRFRAGLTAIAEDPDAMLAFRLANRVFEMCRAAGAWRLFQLVFFVSQIADMTSLKRHAPNDWADREIVEIIHAPTGSGKTEAYLAVIAFHCFFDRLRGKTAGVTAWMRFPLRLLTVQQTQRVAEVIAAAERVRRDSSDARLSGDQVDGFAVGYFVGKEATPNEIVSPRAGDMPKPEWVAANDPDGRRDWNRVPRCPACRRYSIYVDFDPQTVRVLHRCRTPECVFSTQELPVYVVDNEVYRYLPSVVVGTIDKLAALGNQQKMAMLLGAVDGRCKVHGYYLGKCCQKDCSGGSRLVAGPPKGLSGPTLFVQDELHLLKEGLGTFDAHYETYTQTLLRRMGNAAPVKIIASTATVEAYDRQVEHLYGRSRNQARVFPGEGPELGSSFYSLTHEYPQRIFAGLMPHNKTVFNALLELLQYYHEELQILQRLPALAPNPYGGNVQPGTGDWSGLLDNYATSLTYFLQTSDLDGIRHDLDTHTRAELEAEGFQPLRLHELSGSVPTWEVASTLNHLETPQNGLGPPDSVVATSMVSHGVDIDRLNAMFFYGMPRNTAEYIQSSSRVGRKYLGLVFVCFAPARERDQSHYLHFQKNHEFLGQMIEPVAINRWAAFALRRTLPGLFMAHLLQWVSRQHPDRPRTNYYRVPDVQRMIHEGVLGRDDFIEVLREAYLGHAAPAIAQRFDGELRDGVDQALDQIVGASGATGWVSDALEPHPMMSLRDVDEQLPIDLDYRGREWGRRNDHSRGD